ncbi:uncharacterized protein TNCV_4948141 [Trichonephila clavipes]|nr:uncharacterized protein TNCV_4948141 [Trichonephila clavipes]
MPVDVENIVMKVFAEFSCSAKKQEDLKECFDFFEIEYREVIRHVPTRWLSLFKALDRMLSSWGPLKENFFNSLIGLSIQRTGYRKLTTTGLPVRCSSPVPLKTRRVGQRCTLNLSREGVPAQVSSTSLDHGSKTWSVAKGPRVAEQCDVNIQSINQSSYHQYLKYVDSYIAA